MKIAIRRGRVVDPASAFDQVTDLFIAAGEIVSVGAAPADWHSNREINAEGFVVAPGLVVTNAHVAAGIESFTVDRGAGKEFPVSGEDFSVMLFRKRNCCASAY